MIMIVSIAATEVEHIRKVLDPFVKTEPEITTYEKIAPGVTFLAYRNVREVLEFMFLATQHGANSCREI